MTFEILPVKNILTLLRRGGGVFATLLVFLILPLLLDYDRLIYYNHFCLWGLKFYFMKNCHNNFPPNFFESAVETTISYKKLIVFEVMYEERTCFNRQFLYIRVWQICPLPRPPTWFWQPVRNRIIWWPGIGTIC